VNPSKPWATARAIQGRRYDGFNTVNGDKGRLSWTLNYSNIFKNQGIDVNYKSRNASRELSKLKTGKDGQLSVVRVRIKKAPLIIADMAGKGTAMYSQGKGRTRPYQINRFGKGVVTSPGHRINIDNSNTFVENLQRAKESLSEPAGKASRYAWPAFEKHQPKFRSNFDKLLQDVVNEVNRKFES
jgi:flagellar hook-basal body complex protein FliE